MPNSNEEVKVIFPAIIHTYLTDLIDTLLENDYFYYIESADALIDDILDFAYSIPSAPKYNLSPLALIRFGRYGKDMQYTFFKRPSSKHTTWYIFFTCYEDRYIIRYITNNHKDGQYIRGSFISPEE